MEYPSNELNKETDDAVYFYTPEFYALDNFSAYSISVWGKDFPTSERAFQWKKFADIEPDTDDFWGVGPDGNGRNELGKLWMKIRAELI